MPHDESKRLGSYVLEREIAEGGMGVVYRGHQPALERTVALKKLRRDLLRNASLIERFEREARVAASVQHPNVVAVYDCFSFRSDRYIVQEWVDGADLRTLLERAGRVPPAVAARIGLEIARGLEEIHARGIVHRDLKPANVLLGRRGEAKIADFGIVLPPEGDALTELGTVLGSPPYMAPEQLDGQPVDARSDLYALGVLLYELLCGRLPHPAAATGESTVATARRGRRARHASVRSLAAGTPRAVARVVHACLRARPRRRLQTATDVRRRLEAALGTPTPGECREDIAHWLRDERLLPEPSPKTAPLPVRKARSTRRAAAGAVAAALVCGCLITGSVGYRPDSPARDMAESVAPVRPAEPPPELVTDSGEDPESISASPAASSPEEVRESP